MIEELPSRRLAYRFTHELVRRALYDAADRRAARGAAPARRRGAGALRRALGRGLADLAHHFTAAAPLGGAERGVEYNVLAARAAARRAGVRRGGRAAARRARARASRSPRERAELLLELGTARHRAGRAVDALAAFAEAAEIAARAGDAELLARAAIGYEDACWRPVITDRVAVELLERAAAALGEEPSQLRVGVLGGLARALQIRGEHERGAAVRDGGRRDGAARSATAPRSPPCWSAATGRAGRSSPEQVLEMLTEARDIADELGDVELRTEAMNWRVRRAGRGCATSTRRAARSPRCARRPSGRRSRSTSTSPSTAARRSRCARAGSRTPRRWPGARTSGAGC